MLENQVTELLKLLRIRKRKNYNKRINKLFYCIKI